MDWTHCNKCYYMKSSGGGVQLYCGSCCHIICKNCLNTKCPVCDKQFNYTEITDKIKLKAPNLVHSYFEDLIVCRQNLQKRAKFQWEQRTRLENEQIKIFDEINKDKNEVIELRKNEKLLKTEIREDLRKIKQCKNFIKKVRSSSLSARQISKHSFDNLRTFTNSGSEINNLNRKDDSGVFGFTSKFDF